MSLVGLWSRLPSDIEEWMLSFLPVPVLCRFRTVCKRWNSLICKPQFGALCIQNAKEDVGFIFTRNKLFMGKLICKWSILDVKARRWYTIDDEEVIHFNRFRCRPLAMDGGLVCHVPADMSAPGSLVSVFNPFAKTTRELPYSPYFSTIGLFPELNMVVDISTHNYKIFMTNSRHQQGTMSLEHPLMLVYESTTNQWQRLSNPPMPLRLGLELGNELGFEVVCTVFFQGMLYVLFRRLYPVTYIEEYGLWSYHHGEDAWKNTDTMVTDPAQLIVVGDNRLFLVTQLDRSPCGYSLDISEFLFDEWRTRRTTVFQMTNESLLEVFEMRFIHMHDIIVVGIGNSCIVLISRESGISIVVDLKGGSWDHVLPRHPLTPDFWWSRHDVYYAKHMNLILPCTEWYSMR